MESNIEVQNFASRELIELLKETLIIINSSAAEADKKKALREFVDTGGDLETPDENCYTLEQAFGSNSEPLLSTYMKEYIGLKKALHAIAESKPLKEKQQAELIKPEALILIKKFIIFNFSSPLEEEGYTALLKAAYKACRPDLYRYIEQTKKENIGLRKLLKETLSIITDETRSEIDKKRSLEKFIDASDAISIDASKAIHLPDENSNTLSKVLFGSLSALGSYIEQYSYFKEALSAVEKNEPLEGQKSLIKKFITFTFSSPLEKEGYNALLEAANKANRADLVEYITHTKTENLALRKLLKETLAIINGTDFEVNSEIIKREALRKFVDAGGSLYTPDSNGHTLDKALTDISSDINSLRKSGYTTKHIFGSKKELLAYYMTKYSYFKQALQAIKDNKPKIIIPQTPQGYNILIEMPTQKYWIEKFIVFELFPPLETEYCPALVEAAHKVNRPDLVQYIELKRMFMSAIRAIKHSHAGEIQKYHIKKFIDAGGNINSKDNFSMTLLHHACCELKANLKETFNVDIVNYILLKFNGNPLATNQFEETPLHLTLQFNPSRKNSIEKVFNIIAILLEKSGGLGLCERSLLEETPIDTFKKHVALKKDAGAEMPFLKEVEDSPLLTIYNIIEGVRPKEIIKIRYVEKGSLIKHKKVTVFLPTDSKNIWLITKYCQEKGLSSEEIKQYREIVIKFANELEMTIEDVEKLLLQAASTSLQQPSAMQLGPHNRRK